MAALDGSPNSMKAFDQAVDLARVLGAELAIVHAIPDPRTGIIVEYGRGYGSMAVVNAYVKAWQDEAVRWLGPLEAKARQRGLKVNSDVLWEAGKAPAQLITEYAEENSMDLIVMGTRGIGSFKRLLLGTVASGVVGHAPCSVLVVK
jgi:nucleotide-binding universal stress UspA family protein